MTNEVTDIFETVFQKVLVNGEFKIQKQMVQKLEHIGYK
jgi:hypothetical protein